MPAVTLPALPQGSASPPPAEQPQGATPLHRSIAEALRKLGSTDTGAGLIVDGKQALALRVAATRQARQSLDLQYYAWHGDLTGRLLALEALQAADRGVRVRILLDDVFALGRERVLAALDSHPHIGVQLFNGTRWPAFGRLGYALELMLGGWHLNRRMHNKIWIVDGCLAIAGGRNVGDEYFDAAETFNFRDLDLLVAGTAVHQASAVFERYWQSPLARSAGEVSAARDAKGGLAALRRELEAVGNTPDAHALLQAVPGEAALPGQLATCMTPVSHHAIRVVADPPEKARRGLGARRRARAAGGLGPEIADALRKAQSEALLISPYFVPGEAGADLLVDLAKRGVRVSVVTNSLAATDVVAVHGGYSRYRERLLEAGIVLFELKASGDETASVFGSRGASLHTKAFVIDAGPVCVGSFNFDPRSAALNTEMAVFADHPALAEALRAEQARLAEPARSWRLALVDGRLEWRDLDEAGRPRARTTEAGASLRRRIIAALVRILPIEAQL